MHRRPQGLDWLVVASYFSKTILHGYASVAAEGWLIQQPGTVAPVRL